MPWSKRRQFVYAASFIGVLLVSLGLLLFFTFYNKAPTCFDNIQNGSEIGIDCGGACSQVCPLSVAPLVIKWSRVFLVTPGNYSAVAYVDNPNDSAGVKLIEYRFDFFDDKGALIASRSGSTYIAPGAISPVFESNIDMGGASPARAFFEFTKDPVWFRAVDISNDLSIQNRSLVQTETRPKINASISNSSPTEEYKNIDIVTVVFGTDGNAIAASETTVPLLPPLQSENIVFTWPLPFKKRVEQCVRPSEIVLLLDVSGSMDDDGSNPPQPLSDAKSSAFTFINRLSDEDRVGAVSFATEAVLINGLSSKHLDVQEAIAGLTIAQAEEGGKTNIGDAISRATAELASTNSTQVGSDAPPRQVVILLTDGKANAPEEPGGELFAQEKAQEAKADGIVIYTIGLGNKVNAEFLASTASSPDNYYQAATSKDLEGIYRSVSEAICERGPAIIDIIPRTKDVFK